MTTVEFISYDGKWPCLCSGTLRIRIDNKTYSLENCLISGGYIEKVLDGDDYDYEAFQDEWDIDLNNYPELKEYRREILEVVNYNIPWGCCGGCC